MGKTEHQAGSEHPCHADVDPDGGCSRLEWRAARDDDILEWYLVGNADESLNLLV